MESDNLEPVFWPYDCLQADAIRQELQAQGIFCHLEGENQAGMAGSGFLGNVGRWRMRLLVRTRDLDKARTIIEQGDWPTYA